MPKTPSPERGKPSRDTLKLSTKEQSELLDDVQENTQASEDAYLNKMSADLDEKESILLGDLTDNMSKNAKSKVYDPRLATIVFERAARVMAQRPTGKFFAKSQDDLGKNMLMNLTIDHYMKNANEGHPFVIKLRQLDIYSQVYGSMFAMVPWRVNTLQDYIGPEVNLLSMRNCKPQPDIINLDESDWFQYEDWVSIAWLEAQSDAYWNKEAIKSLKDSLKKKKSGGDERTTEAKERTVSQDKEASNQPPSENFPRVRIITEYRRDKWVTYTPKQTNEKTDKPYILRVVGNEDKPPYPGGMLPIVVKHNFPMIDRLIGLGEFERGKSLQYAINSLINLYLDGVKYSIFPPLAINIDGVTPGSIEWGPGNRWFMDRPNQDVQPVKLDSATTLNTFQSTYNFLLSAIMNQAGTSEITSQGNTEPTLGRTPEAVEFLSKRESARDEWDRVMMEETIKDIMKRWSALIADKNHAKLVNPLQIRLFGEEIEAIKSKYPDVKDFSQIDLPLKMHTSKETGMLEVTKDSFGGVAYDYEIDVGSTQRTDLEMEQKNLISLFQALQNENLLNEMRKRGKDVNFAELAERIAKGQGIRDVDKVIVDFKPEEEGAPAPSGELPPEGLPLPPQGGEAMPIPGMPGQEGGPVPVPGPVPGPQGPPLPPQAGLPIPPSAGPAGIPGVDLSGIEDPEILAAIQQTLGGIEGVPAQ